MKTPLPYAPEDPWWVQAALWFAIFCFAMAVVCAAVFPQGCP